MADINPARDAMNQVRALAARDGFSEKDYIVREVMETNGWYRQIATKDGKIIARSDPFRHTITEHGVYTKVVRGSFTE